MADTKRVGAEVAAAEPRIDVLINNAGAMFGDRRLTPEGLELTFALNHMAYFVLTHALKDRLVGLRAGANRLDRLGRASARASSISTICRAQRGYSGYGVYGGSKLANILFTRELARRLAGTGVTANCLHPGVVATRFGDSSSGLFATVIPLVARPLFITPEKGADTIIYLASSPEVEKTTGEYFDKRKAIQPSAAARDDAAAKRLWTESEKLAGFHW